MTNLISKESQDAYKTFQSFRVDYFDYEHVTREQLSEMTKANTIGFEKCAKDLLKDVKIEHKDANGVDVEEITIPGAIEGKYMYYIHGGGFVQGEAAWGHYCAVKIAKETKCNIIGVNYRLAPEYPFPYAPSDCITVYEWMLRRGIDSENIVLMGESSGGNLVLAVALGAKERHMALPACIVSISPVVNLNFSYPSFREREDRECIIPRNQDRFAQFCYMQDKDLSNPLASPIFGNTQGFPPVFLGVGTEEMLFDDSIKMHEKLLRDGVDSILVVWEGMWHTHYMMDFPETEIAHKEISEFIKRVWHE